MAELEIMSTQLAEIDPELLMLIVEKLDIRHQGRFAACCKLFGLLVVELVSTTPFLASTASGANVPDMLNALNDQARP